MKKPNKKAEEAAMLRQKAEELLQGKDKVRFDSTPAREAEMLKLIHEMRLHQIELEMQNKELVLAKEKAELAEEKYTELYDFAPAGYLSISKDGQISKLNFAAARILGRERSKLLKHRFAHFISLETLPVFNLFVEKVFASNAQQTCEVIIVTEGHSPIHATIAGIVSTNHEFCHLTVSDITQRKQAEDRERFQAHILKSINKAVIVTTPAGIVTFVNQFAETMYGWAATDAIGKNIMELTVPEIYSAQALEIMSSLSKGKNWQGEFMVQRQNGSLMMVQVVNTPIMDEHGNITAIAGISSDITKRKAAEEALRESEARLNLAQAVTKVGSWETDLSTLKVIWSDQTYEIFDLDPKTFQASHQAFLEFVHPHDRAQVDIAFKNSFDNDDYNTIEHRIITAKGVIKYVEERWKIFQNDQNHQLRAIGTCQDITERKKADTELQKAKDLLTITNRIARIGAWEMDLINNQMTWTDITREIHEVDSSYVLNLEEAIYFYKEGASRETILNLVNRAIETGEGFNVELQFITAKGNELWVRSVCQAEFAGDKVVRLYGTFQDIDKEKKNQLKIEESTTNLKEAQSMAKLGRWELNLVTNQLDWSDSIFEIFEIDKEQFEATYEAFLDAIHPDDRQLVNDAYTRSLETKQPYEIEHRLQMADGRIKYLKASGRTDYDGNGKPLRSTGIAQDITEQKKAEVELSRQKQFLELANQELKSEKSKAEESEKKYRDLADNTLDLIYSFDLDSRFIMANERVCEANSRTLEDIIGKNFIDLGYPKEEADKWFALHSDVIRNGETIYQLTQPSLPHGKIHEFETYLSPIYDINNKITGIRGISRDITERRKAEETLRENQARFEMALIAGNQGAWLVDWQKKTNIVDERWAAMLGYSLDEVGQALGFWESKVHPDDLKKLYSVFELHERGEIPMIDVDVRARTKNGEWKWISDRAQILKRMPNGQPWILAGVHTDITERKQSELERELISVRLDLATKAANIGIWDFNIVENQIIWDEQMFALYGITRETFSGAYEAWLAGIHPDDMERGDKETEQAIKGEKEFDTEFRVIWPDGSIHHIRALAKVLRDDEGKALHLVGTNWDITEQKQAELELKATQQKLNSIFGEMEDVVWSMSYPSLETLFVTPSVETLYGYPLQQWMAQGSTLSQQVIHPLDRDLVSQMFERLEKDHKVEQSYRVVTASGITKWVNSKIRVIKDQNDSPIRLDGQVSDITERKKADIERQLSVRLNLATKAANIGIWDYNLVENQLIWDDQMFALYGITRETCTGVYEAWRAGLHPDDMERGDSEMERAIEGEKEFDTEFRVVWPNGSIHYIRALAKVVRDDEGKAVRMVGTNWDITEQKRTEEELMLAKEKAEESDRLKTAFLANMSHEIRTPMNGIMGFANLLQKQGITPQKEKEYLTLIQKSGTRMLNIINDIISISKIESGELPITLSPTNINEKLEFIRAFFEPEASAKGIQIVVSSALPVHKAVVTTDQEKVYGTLANLVKNAIKFTHAGTIELGCQETAEQAELEFFVKDMGIGIPHHQLDFIFERFRQVNESSTRNYEGAGLGLAISKAQVEKLGGKIWAESEVGKGSTFYFTIPCQRDLPGTQVQAAEPDPLKNKEQSHQRIKIVLAEDDFMSATYLKEVLNINGNEILHATTGTEAVEIVRNNPDTDVVLMDLSMPQLNGYEATSQIRQFNKTVAIIIQSGYTFEENIKEATESGCTAYISKPVSENELLRMIEKHVRK